MAKFLLTVFSVFEKSCTFFINFSQKNVTLQLSGSSDICCLKLIVITFVKIIIHKCVNILQICAFNVDSKMVSMGQYSFHNKSY